MVPTSVYLSLVQRKFDAVQIQTLLLTASRRQFNDDFSTKIDGGILIYYVSAQPGKITAFKPVSFNCTVWQSRD